MDSRGLGTNFGVKSFVEMMHGRNDVTLKMGFETNRGEKKENPFSTL